MKLETLTSFELLNESEMIVIAGGLLEADSKSKDVSSTSNDSLKHD